MPKRADALRLNYGISEEHYRWLRKKQRGRCAICRRKNERTQRWRRFVVDHNHQSGCVRGLLCNDCNLGLGKFADCSKRTAQAVCYLKQDGLASALLKAALPEPKPRGRKYKPNARKLTRQRVFAIRRKVNAGQTQTAVAKAFGVSQEMVSRIIRGKAWRIREHGGKRF